MKKSHLLILTVLCISCAPKPADLVITNARVIDGRGGVIENVTVVIADGRIREVSDDPSVPVEFTIDAAGRTVMPGLDFPELYSL